MKLIPITLYRIDLAEVISCTKKCPHKILFDTFRADGWLSVICDTSHQKGALCDFYKSEVCCYFWKEQLKCFKMIPCSSRSGTKYGFYNNLKVEFPFYFLCFIINVLINNLKCILPQSAPFWCDVSHIVKIRLLFFITTSAETNIILNRLDFVVWYCEDLLQV